MSFKAFDMAEIEANTKKYAAEAKDCWGNTKAYAECKEKTNGYDEDKWKQLSGEGAEILQAFGELRTMEPMSLEAQALVEKWQAYITAHYYCCTKEILYCLSQMYVGDERFTKNIDQYGEGTATFMAAAIEVYCDSNGIA